LTDAKEGKFFFGEVIPKKKKTRLADVSAKRREKKGAGVGKRSERGEGKRTKTLSSFLS